MKQNGKGALERERHAERHMHKSQSNETMTLKF